MTQQVLQRSAPVNRRHPLLTSDENVSPPRDRRRAGEMVGGATAECAAVCCCFPCAVMDLVALAVCKVPAGLFKKAMHKRKRRRVLRQKKKNDALLQQRHSSADGGGNVGPTLEEHLAKEAAVDAAGKAEAVELEKEMWARFSGTGFWRSSSQRQQPQLQTGD